MFFTATLIVGFIFIFFVLPQLMRFKVFSDIIKRGRVTQQYIRAGAPDEIPHLDRDKLNQISQQLTALGFTPLADLVSFTPPPAGVQSMPPLAAPTGASAPPPAPDKTACLMRLFSHPVHGCLAQVFGVTSIMPLGAGQEKVTTKMFASFISFSVTQTDGQWVYATTNHPPESTEAAITALFRRPRALWSRVETPTLSEVLQFHLQRRTEVANAARVQWDTQPTLDAVYANEADVIRRIRQAFENLTPIGFYLHMKRSMNQHKRQEWLGELEGKL